MGSEGPLAWCYELYTLTHNIDKLFRDSSILDGRLGKKLSDVANAAKKSTLAYTTTWAP